jgi:hypothetical protein
MGNCILSCCKGDNKDNDNRDDRDPNEKRIRRHNRLKNMDRGINVMRKGSH